jgi:hypothetical protein
MTGDKCGAPRPDMRMRRRDHQEQVNRAKGRLVEILSIEDASDLGADRATRTVVNSSLSGWRRP